jgi:hypothetical protein
MQLCPIINLFKNKMKNLKIILSVLLLTILASCSKSDDVVAKPDPEQVYPPYVYNANVYVAGFEGSKAKIWKNGIGTELPDGNSATSVFVSGTDVYACGSKTVSGNIKGQIWKNGLLYATLSPGYNYVGLNSVFVSGSNVYACGYVQNTATGKAACYWKDGVIKFLTNTSLNNADDTATGIFVVGNSVYVCGTERNGAFDPISKVWNTAGSVLLTLNTNAIDTFVTGIAVVGNDIYVSGHEQNPNGSNRKPVYFKNLVKTYLTISAGAAEGNTKGITTSGTDVYSSGYELSNLASSNSYFWKNGVATNLTSPNTEFSSRDHSWTPNGIAVLNGSVYQSANNGYLGNSNAMFLDGSRPVYLTNSETVISSANGIFVAPL